MATKAGGEGPVVGDTSLRVFDPDGAELAYELVERGVDGLYVVSTPEGPVEAMQAERGELVVFGYTTAAGLVAACGRAQPWERLSIGDLIRLADESDSPVVFAADVWHPAGARYPEPNDREREPMAPVPRHEPITEVWIPSLPMAPGASAAQVEMFAVTPGRPILLAYESAEDLRECCGPHQAGIAVSVEHLEEVARQAGADAVLFDIVLGDEYRHQAPVVDWTRHNLFDDPIAH